MVETTAIPAPAMPSAGNGPRPKIRHGDSGTSSTTPALTASAGTSMLPVPRIDARQRVHQPDQRRAGEDDIRIGQRRGERAALAAERPVQRGAEAEHQRGEQAPPIATLMTIACSTSASASSRRPPPRARATADEMPPPIAPADSICIIMNPGKTSATPASASRPSRETHQVSISPVEAVHQHDGDIRPGQPQQHRRDRGFEQTPGPRVEGKAAGGCRDSDRGYRLAGMSPASAVHPTA